MTSRRTVLAGGLGLGAGLLGLGAGGATAAAARVTLDGLGFDLPSSVREVPVDEVVPGGGWGWAGRRTPAADRPGVLLVLARADLASSDAEEVAGWLLGGGLAGTLPGLAVQARRGRATPGGGRQNRLDLTYVGAGGTRWSGTLLVAVRDEGPAGAVALLGDRLSAGEVTAVLDSVAWSS